MSYLLEALQKSQKEREQNVPGIQTPALQVEVPDEAPRSPWIYIAIAALAINTVLIVYLLLRPNEPVAVVSEPSAAQTPVASTSAVSPSSTVSTISTVSPAPPTPSTSAADRVQVRDLDALPSDASSHETISRESTPLDATPRVVTREIDTTTAPTMPTVMAADAASQNNAAITPAPANNSEQVIDVDLFSVPTVNQLANEIRQQLPALEMNSHIYAPNEKDSFVMINGISLTPGMMLMPNLKLLAITADGAVLQFSEHKFLLPALSSFKP